MGRGAWIAPALLVAALAGCATNEGDPSTLPVTASEATCWETLEAELPEVPEPTDPRTAIEALERGLRGTASDTPMRQLMEDALSQARTTDDVRFTFDVQLEHGTGRVSLTEREGRWYVRSATVPLGADDCAPSA